MSLIAFIADISTIAAVGIAAPQFTSRRQEYRSELGACYYIEVPNNSDISSDDHDDIADSVGGVQLVVGDPLIPQLQEGEEDQLPQVPGPL